MSKCENVSRDNHVGLMQYKANLPIIFIIITCHKYIAFTKFPTGPDALLCNRLTQVGLIHLPTRIGHLYADLKYIY